MQLRPRRAAAARVYRGGDRLERDLVATPYGSVIKVGLGTKRNWSDHPGLSNVRGMMIPRSERQHIVSAHASRQCRQRKTGDLECQPDYALIVHGDEVIHPLLPGTDEVRRELNSDGLQGTGVAVRGRCAANGRRAGS